MLFLMMCLTVLDNIMHFAELFLEFELNKISHLEFQNI